MPSTCSGTLRRRCAGFSLVEALIVLAILTVMLAAGLPQLRAYSLEVHLLGAGQTFKGQFRKARSIAALTNRYTAIRFERQGGEDYFSVYSDGNLNGVLSSEITSGIDTRISGPYRLAGGSQDVTVGINPGTPAIPPARGTLDTSDPIQFGRANMLSFSPMGTATPGTFYLAGQNIQGAVRVTGDTARVRLMVCRGGRWVER
jgi:prepilin-type N-terminal cleavage/methylation domain-containing protein